jgi:hypothetical protein
VFLSFASCVQPTQCGRGEGAAQRGPRESPSSTGGRRAEKKDEAAATVPLVSDSRVTPVGPRPVGLDLASVQQRREEEGLSGPPIHTRTRLRIRNEYGPGTFRLPKSTASPSGERTRHREGGRWRRCCCHRRRGCSSGKARFHLTVISHETRFRPKKKSYNA